MRHNTPAMISLHTSTRCCNSLQWQAEYMMPILTLCCRAETIGGSAWPCDDYMNASGLNNHPNFYLIPISVPPLICGVCAVLTDQ